MNKFLRISVPMILACMLLGMLFYLVRVSSRAVAADNLTEKSVLAKELVKSSDKSQATLLVTTLEDELNQDGDCSLREAIEAANTNSQVDGCGSGDVLTDTITFSVNGTIILNNELLVNAGGPLVIDGGNVITTSGGGTTRVWWVDIGSQLTMENLTITEGYLDYENGAGIINNGNLIIKSSQIDSNHCKNRGSGIYNNGTLTISNSSVTSNGSYFGASEGGGIYSLGPLSFINSVLSNNYIGYQSGGIYNGSILTITNSILSGNEGGGVGGGAIHNSGTLNIDQSTFTANSTHDRGGAINNLGTVNITNSTFSGNSSGFEGGGIYNVGPLHIANSMFNGNSGSFSAGGIRNANLLTITNSTFSLNNGGESGGGIQNTGNMTITNSTLSQNNAYMGGGIYGFEVGNALVQNTIIANNFFGSDCYGEIIDGGHNLDSDGSCGLNPENGSLPGTDPMLGPLQDNGGPTWTHALLSGSPAIDSGDNANCPATDQRGIPRPIDGDGDGEAVCDIGAFEAPSPPENEIYLPVVSKF